MVSILEELAIMLLILIDLKEDGLLSSHRWRKNIKRIMLVAVLPIAIASNAMMFIGSTLHIQETADSVRNLVVLLMVIISTFQLQVGKTKKRTVFYAIIKVYVLMMVMELGTMFFAKYILNIDLQNYLNKSAINNFVITLPIRIIQYMIIFAIIYKKNSILNEMKYFEILKKSKELTNKNKLVSKILFYTRIVIIISFMLIARLIMYQQVFLAMPLGYQLMIITFLLLPMSVPMVTTAIAVSILKDQIHNEQFGKEVNFDEQDS